jgi:hypothetical protein
LVSHTVNGSTSDIRISLVPLLASLLDKSLLHRNGAGRYDMHELVRQYADERLRESPDERDQVYARHCGYFVALLQRHAASHPASEKYTRDRALGVLNELEARLSPEQLRSARERGQARTFDELAVALRQGAL